MALLLARSSRTTDRNGRCGYRCDGPYPRLLRDDEPHVEAKIIAEANSLADKEEDISAEDRRHIIFCPIHGIEEVVCTSTEESFLASLKAAGEENMPGGSFARLTARRRRRREAIEPKQFPFELDDLLRWWKRTNDIKGRERSSLTRQALCTA